MTRWPWISALAGLAAAASSPGQDLFRVSFFSGEQLARSLSGFLLSIAIAIWVGLVLIEWLVRWFLNRRRLQRASTAAME